MSESSTPILTGLSVLVAGLVAFATVVVQGAEPAAETATSSSQEQTAPTSLPAAVEELILQGGEASIQQPGELAGVPSDVARVLSAYGVPILVPEDGS